MEHCLDNLHSFCRQKIRNLNKIKVDFVFVITQINIAEELERNPDVCNDGIFKIAF